MKHALLFGSLITLGACAAEPATESATSSVPSASEEVFEIIAQIELDGGRVTFLDESIGKEVGVGILEEGDVNLGPLYEQEGTALEIFLAIAPPDMAVPEVLYRAHDMARLRDSSIPEQPRALATSFGELNVPKSISYHGFAKDTNNCWGWGGLRSYDPHVGNAPGTFGGHQGLAATQEFETWSTIPGGTIMTTDLHAYEQSAELVDQYYETATGHERALAMCVTHAYVAEPQFEDCDITNTVDYRVRLVDSTSWGSSTIQLTGYGQGVRYRSSSSDARKYTLRVIDASVDSLNCKERFQVDMRSRFAPTLAP